MTSTKLVIVIHAEEEFDWDSGFYRSQTGVTYADNLIDIVDQILALGAKVTLAMDYPFVMSDGGQKVIGKYKSNHHDNIEFATHLHPWVTPPFETDDDEVSNTFSYPGNLPENSEYQKVKTLTETIEKETGFRPQTYLAGRYGIGEHTNKIIESLGYNLDLSISAYCDFSHQEGPDFSHFTNKKFQKKQITYLPHTSSVLSILPVVENYLNQTPDAFTKIQSNRLMRVMGKILRIKKFRLSPEGFSFKHMYQVTKSQLNVGQRDFIMSFHSPSSKPGLTPYVRDENDLNNFKKSITDYISWFKSLENSQFCIAQDLVKGNE